VPATIFLATAYLDSTEPFPFDNWQPIVSRQECRDAWIPMTREQCRAALASGLIEFGCHTHTHQVFRDRPAEFLQDLTTSVDVLRHDFHIDHPPFSFPFGIADEALVAAARQTDITCGLGTTPTLVATHSDPFTWGRFGVSESETAGALIVKLSGWYDAVRQIARPVRPGRPTAKPVSPTCSPAAGIPS
ncbi:MAG: hypothetical protein B7Z55_07120, partial [Planctomycetales bacterium 12-60-4]